MISELIITVFFLFSCSKITSTKITTQNTTLPTKQSLISVEKEKVIELIINLKNNLAKQENYYTNTSGIVSTFAFVTTHKQKVESTIIKNGQLLFKESISTSSLKQVAEQMIIDEGTCYIRSAKKISSSVTWNNEFETKDFNTYLDEYGTNPYEFTGYEIDLKSITWYSISDNKIELKLDPLESTKKYAKEIKRMANSNDYPKFSLIEITILYNKDYLIEKVIIHEIYELDFPVFGSLSCTNNMDIKYFYEKKEINDFR